MGNMIQPETRTMSQLRNERERQGLSLRELAHFADTSAMTVSRLERGEGEVSPAVKARVARALRVSVEKLWPLNGGSEGAAGEGGGDESKPAA